MALDPRRRQKKVERKKAKDKTRKVENQRREKIAAARESALIAVSPIYACRIQESLEDQGIAQAVIARELPDYRLALGVFLIDSYCLGIKDAFYRIVTRGEYQDFVDGLEASGKTRKIEPAALKRLIDGAIAYARQLGFEPARDYYKAELMLQAIDTSTCVEEFKFGREGKPYYICGPHDSAARQHQILGTLRRTQGDDGFDFLALIGSTQGQFLPPNFKGDAESAEPLIEIIRNAPWADDEEQEQLEDEFDDDEEDVIDVPFKTPNQTTS